MLIQTSNSRFLSSVTGAAALFLVLLTFLVQPVGAADFSPLQRSGLETKIAGPQFLPVEQAFQVTAELDGHTLQLNWEIAPGYYLYQNQFRAFLQTKSPIETALPQQFAQGVEKFDEYYGQNLVVYYDTTPVRITLPGTGAHQQIRFVSQGCADAGLCYPPRTQYISVDLDTGVTQISTEPGAPLSGSSEGKGIDSGLPSGTGLSQLPAILLFALIGGLILNLMPCVFPVLSIKAVGLAAAHLGARHRHRHGLAYTAGILSAFLAVAVLLLSLRATGEAIGWGFQLQSSLFVTYLAYLFFLMGLGFSGAFRFGQGLMGVGQGLTRGRGLGSSFATGMLATVVASPCTAPFMGTALGFALTQPPLVAILVFLFLGLGMALPFLLLSWWPKLGEHMPPPGRWMETFQQLLAFPLYLSAVWLFWVLGRQTNSDTQSLAAAGLVALAFAAWLWRRNTRPAAMMAAIILGLGLALPILQNKQVPAQKLWEPYTSARLQALRRDGYAVFVNLTADWCITCIANEKLALSSDTFQRALAENGVIYLKGDWTNNNPEITELLERFNRSGVPLYLYFRGDGSPPTVLPQLLTEKMVTDILSR